MKTAIFSKIKTSFLKLSSKSRGKEKSKERYMDSKEFHNAVLDAVKKGAKDQDKYMKSVGASWD